MENRIAKIMDIMDHHPGEEISQEQRKAMRISLEYVFDNCKLTYTDMAKIFSIIDKRIDEKLSQ